MRLHAGAIRAFAALAVAGLVALTGSEAFASTPSPVDRVIPGLSVQISWRVSRDRKLSGALRGDGRGDFDTRRR